MAQRTTQKIWQKREKELTPQQRKIREDSLDALHLVRKDRYSLTRASKKVGQSSETIVCHTNAFRKIRRHWRVKKFDRIPRSMVIYEKGRKRIVELRDSRNASLIGKYHNIIRQFLETGDSSVLKSIRRKRFKDSKGRVHILETRPEKIYEIKEREAKPEIYQIYDR